MGKIALVHDFLLSYGGAERVLSELHEMYPEAPIYTLLVKPETVSRHFPRATIVTSSLQRSPLRHRQQLLLPRLPRAIEEFNFNEFDKVISSSGAFAHGIITGPVTEHICYCHSPMRYAWDWHAEYLHEHGVRSSSLLMAASSVMNGIRIWDYVASKRVDRWIANSVTVQKRIQKFYGQRSTVVYPPVDTEFFSAGSSTTENYAITVNRLSKYKRVDLLITACAAQKLPLRIVGEGPERANLQKLAQKLRGDVTFLGRIDDVQLRDQLQGARCYISAVEEDFGIAPVEALASGIPVLALGKGGVTETVEEGRTGMFFSEPTVEAITEVLQRFLATGVSANRTALQASASRFSRLEFRKAIEHA